jgi:hypothetical protein
MVSWVKSSLILVVAIGMVLIIASTQGWPVTLWLTGSIIALLAAIMGLFDNDVSARRASATDFLLPSTVVFFAAFCIDQMVRYGFRALMVGVLTGDGAQAASLEITIFWSLIVEIILCVLMIRYIPSHTVPDDDMLRASHDGGARYYGQPSK